MARLIYTLFFYLATPLIVARLLWRSRRSPAYRRRWRERFGWVPPVDADRQVIWVHSVSVGETLAAIPLIKGLQQRHPQALVVVTTMTPTGSERVRAAFGDSVYHVYAPYDLPGAVRRFLGRVHPSKLVIMETELWPTIIHQCSTRNIPVVVANARLSARSARGYGRIAALTRTMLAEVTLVAAQTQEDGERFLGLGLAPAQLAVAGNIKFDFEVTEERRQAAAELARQWRGGDRLVWLVASTHRGEDEVVLDAFAALRERFPALLLVLVPRHPERFDEVYRLCQATGFSVLRRSQGRAPAADDAILLGDTMGELPVFFGACDVAFVGGSLVPVGGHNLIEPAAWGCPVLSGPHLFNFAEASAKLRQQGGLLLCRDAGELTSAVCDTLADPALRVRVGNAARAVAEANRGALARLLALIDSV